MSESVRLNDLLDNEQTSTLLGIKPNTLEIWRCKGKGPRFIKLGTEKQSPIRYWRTDVADWIERQSFASTSEYSPAAQTSMKSLNRSSADAGC
ncbi:helix-turn-helix domain-containing protein [Roseomonas aeriglobus]|nr:helix-turn-helix domain-containing protein [Roseomonas aeriglobus]